MTDKTTDDVARLRAFALSTRYRSTQCKTTSLSTEAVIFLEGAETLDRAADAMEERDRLKEELEAINQQEFSIGPTNEPCCPKCRNSFQNGVPDGSPHMRRCATCKTVWKLPLGACLLYQVIDDMEKERDRLKAEIADAIDAHAAWVREADDRLCDCANTRPCGSVCNWCSSTKDTTIAKEVEKVREAVRERDRLKEELADMEEEAEGSFRLIEKQSALLTGVVNAIRGEPDEMSRHSHHDAPAIAKAVAEERDRLREAVKVLREGLEEIKAAKLIPGLYHGGETYYGLNERIKGVACGAVTLADAILAGKEVDDRTGINPDDL